MTRSFGSISVQLLNALLMTIGAMTVSCSAKNEENILSSSNVSPRKKNNSDVVVVSDDPFGLLSAVPFRTYLNSFVSDVRGPAGSSYRYALMDGDSLECANWSEFRTVSEPLKISFGMDGDKTLCLQGQEKSKTAEVTKSYRLRKSSLEEGGPAYTLTNSPAPLTPRAEANILVEGPEVVQYRAEVRPATSCGTLEAVPWQNIDTPLVVKLRYDGDWLLCLDVRDKFGSKNKTAHVHRWTRDTIRPVMDTPVLPEGIFLNDKLELQISGNGVEHYTAVLVDGEADCANANYPAYVPVNQPLNLIFPRDGKYTLCALTGKGTPESADFLIQQRPFRHVFERVSLIANVKINPVPVRRNTSGTLVFQNQDRSFSVSGSSLTHYKYVASDLSLNDCSQQMPPATAAIPIATPLNWTLRTVTSGVDIRSLCVWGMIVNDSGTWIQENPTHVRFYNETRSTTRPPETATPAAFQVKEAFRSCSCHSLFNEQDFIRKAVEISQKIRGSSSGQTMPVGGWKSEEQRIGMLKFLYGLSGYPQDLPLEVSNP
jgi:hypothetical protein